MYAPCDWSALRSWAPSAARASRISPRRARRLIGCRAGCPPLPRPREIARRSLLLAAPRRPAEVCGLALIPHRLSPLGEPGYEKIPAHAVLSEKLFQRGATLVHRKYSVAVAAHALMASLKLRHCSVIFHFAHSLLVVPASARSVRLVGKAVAWARGDGSFMPVPGGRGCPARGCALQRE